MNDWKLLSTIIDGEPLKIDGANVWAYSWKKLDADTLEVPHPSYPNQKHRLRTYFIEAGSKKIIFAAGELSNGVWCFYVPQKDT